ncbi:MAG: tyrosine-type recombinase/integrase [Candidatus Obscuribacterales bacterium]|nr:tyrosine-type recombinase/integrase [Candidatus Obscuribacterales bacterium]
MARKSKPPIRRRNSELRSREYLTPSEVKRLIKAARSSSVLFGRRNAALILFLYRHAMRVSEGTGILWNEVFFDKRTVHIRRLKNSKDSTHVLEHDELRELLWLRARFPKSQYVFCTRNEKRLSRRTVHEIVAKAGEEANLPFPVHPHMLRHSKGYQLADIDKQIRVIQEYFGHRNIQHTVLYTDLASGKFKDFGQKDLI